jgi:hypothetical protein
MFFFLVKKKAISFINIIETLSLNSRFRECLKINYSLYLNEKGVLLKKEPTIVENGKSKKNRNKRRNEDNSLGS